MIWLLSGFFRSGADGMQGVGVAYFDAGAGEDVSEATRRYTSIGRKPSRR